MDQKYEAIRALSESAYHFVLENLTTPRENGKYELENGVYAMVQGYTTHLRKDSKYEAHKAYIDIQIILSGTEIIAVEPLEDMHKYPCVRPYEYDAELYENNPDGIDHVLSAGDFLVLYPQDAHMPGVCVGAPSEVKKIVVKVPVEG